MSKEIPFENSFASHEKAKYWSDKNLLKPNQVSLNSNKKYWFNCDCGHEFNKILSDISGKKKDGVHIVLIHQVSYVIKMIVINVSKNHLLVMIKLNIGVIRMN